MDVEVLVEYLRDISHMLLLLSKLVVEITASEINKSVHC